MAARSANAVDRLADTIRQHFAANPDAADTVTGIQTWWLGGRASTELVELALIRLRSAGEITEKHLPDGTCLYVASMRH